LHNYYLGLSFLLMYSSSGLSTDVFPNKTNIHVCRMVAPAVWGLMFVWPLLYAVKFISSAVNYKYININCTLQSKYTHAIDI